MDTLILCFVFLSLAFIVYALYMVFCGSKQELSHEQLIPIFPQPQFIRLGLASEPQESWSPKSIIKEFNLTKQSISDIHQNYVQPEKEEGLKSYFGYLVEVWHLTVREKEIITFALLQLASIAVGYYLWVQMLSWIPAEVWKTAEYSHHASWPDLILLLWSFVCVGVAALPLGVFSACIGAVYFLRRQGYPSTIAACLKIVLPEVWALWIFQWMDGWITVNQILERLPKKNDRESPARRALSEALYFAWKLGTIGILPGVITGRGLVESCRDSILVVKTKFLDAAKLRVGYSFLCWIIGVTAYVGTIFFFIRGHFVPPGAEIYGFIYTLYFWAGIPLLIAVAFIELFLRPAYIVGSCELYAQYLTEHNKNIMLPHPPSKGVSAFVFFAVLCLFVLIVFLYRESLGINAALSVPYK
jgi:hypothetical protein